MIGGTETRPRSFGPIVMLRDALGQRVEMKKGVHPQFRYHRVLSGGGTVARSLAIREISPDSTTDLSELVPDELVEGTNLTGFVGEGPAMGATTDDAAITARTAMTAYGLTEPKPSPKYSVETSEPSLQQATRAQIEEKVDSLFQGARDQVFEDGIETPFSKGLIELVERYGEAALAEIQYLIVYERTSDELSSEALRWLGRIKHFSTYGWRLWLLERSLSSKSPRVRDGAALGLGSMGDTHAIAYLKEAISRETCLELRQDMEHIITELESIHGAALAKKNP